MHRSCRLFKLLNSFRRISKHPDLMCDLGIAMLCSFVQDQAASDKPCSARTPPSSQASLAKLKERLHAGVSAGLLTKYRPQVPILSVLVPTLKKADGENWMLEGRGTARQCLLHRGLMPLLAQPSASGVDPLTQSAHWQDIIIVSAVRCGIHIPSISPGLLSEDLQSRDLST